MKFERRTAQNAIGWSLAHSVPAGSQRLGKGTVITTDISNRIARDHTGLLSVYKLDAGDVDENEAAIAYASILCGGHVSLRPTGTGRTDLRAEDDGLLCVSDTCLMANQLDEALTFATLPHHSVVRKGELVATAKVIPFAVSADIYRKIGTLDEVIQVKPFKPFQATLIVTDADKANKVETTTKARLSRYGGTLGASVPCPHERNALAKRIETCAQADDTDLILIAGIAATADRRDEIPAAIEQAGGIVRHLGMPVDPGNLLLLGNIRGKTILGLPGCAKTPAPNGIDLVLARFAAGLKTRPADIQAMGRGGLLKGLSRRLAPGVQPHPTASACAIILAAGRSVRAEGTNKLLARISGTPVIAHTVRMIGRALDSAPVVVTGHDSDRIKEALTDQQCSILYNSDYASGMASSLKVGTAALTDTADLVLIALGDMPFIRDETVKALLDAATSHPEYAIFIPVLGAKRGNPVLWRGDMLAQFQDLPGDTGGRKIIHNNEHLVLEVPVNDPGILIDLDTPEKLAEYGLISD